MTPPVANAKLAAMKHTFKQYFSALSVQERAELAEAADTSVAYLNQIASGHRNPGAGLIDRLMTAGRQDIVAKLKPAWFPEDQAA